MLRDKIINNILGYGECSFDEIESVHTGKNNAFIGTGFVRKDARRHQRAPMLIQPVFNSRWKDGVIKQLPN